MERFKVAENSRIAWGKLVKRWVKGQQATPASVAELKDQCAKDGIKFESFPSFITDILFIQKPKETLTIRLPAKDLLEAGEADIAATAADSAYPLPKFYDEFYLDPVRRDSYPVEKRLDLQAARIGEYSVNSCT